MSYSQNSLIKDILADERAVAIVEAHFPGATSHPALDDAQYMSVGEVMSYPEALIFRGKIQNILEQLALLDQNE